MIGLKTSPGRDERKAGGPVRFFGLIFRLDFV